MPQSVTSRQKHGKTGHQIANTQCQQKRTAQTGAVALQHGADAQQIQQGHCQTNDNVYEPKVG